MPEKHIIVDRGIPPGTSQPGQAPGNSNRWKNFGVSQLGIETGASGGLPHISSIDGVPDNRGEAPTKGSPIYLHLGSVEESLGNGDGWPDYESYADLGMNIWSAIPFELHEIRFELAGKLEKQGNENLDTIKRDLKSAGVSHDSVEAINKSLKVVQKKLSQWEGILEASINKLMSFPDVSYLSRTIKEIVADLKAGGEENAPAAIDKELAAFRSAFEVFNNLYIRNFLAAENDLLVDSRSTQKAIEQAKIMALLSAEEQSRMLAQQPLIDNDYISDKEGGVATVAYVPSRNGAPAKTSGVTVGAGVDLGSKTYDALVKDGVPLALAKKLDEYTGFKGKSAKDKITSKPLILSTAEATELSKIYLEKFGSVIEKRYNKVLGSEKFRLIPINTRTAIVDVAFQHGDNLPGNTPLFWNAIINSNWQEVVNILNNFKDEYPTRRAADGKLVQSDIDNKRLP